MKKLLFVIAIASFAACKSGSGDATKVDSTKGADSTKIVADSTKKDSTKIVVDSTKKDTTKK